MFTKEGFNKLIAGAGLTKEKLAKHLGISPVTLHRKINDSGNFDRNEIIKMTEVLDKSETLSLFFE
jgi:plasmid maintenance system antidote protein VapI